MLATWAYLLLDRKVYPSLPLSKLPFKFLCCLFGYFHIMVTHIIHIFLCCGGVDVGYGYDRNMLLWQILTTILELFMHGN